jgi:hypothetical protein
MLLRRKRPAQNLRREQAVATVPIADPPGSGRPVLHVRGRPNGAAGELDALPFRALDAIVPERCRVDPALATANPASQAN